MKLLFVVNPVSGGIDKGPFLEKAKAICAKRDIKVIIYKTTEQDDEQSLQDKLKEDRPDTVLCVGGDGTVRLVAMAIKHTEYKMGIIPMGSANGMATELGIPANSIEALEHILDSTDVYGLDMLLVNEKHHVLHIGDVGTNAQIVKRYAEDTQSGMAAYAKHFLGVLSETIPFEVRVEANEEVVRKKAIMVAICNARKYGTGIPINQVGDPRDGKFEIVIFERVNIPALIKAGLAKLDERFYSNQDSEVISTTGALLHFERDRLLQLDGEIIGKFQDIRVDIMPDAVQLLK